MPWFKRCKKKGCWGSPVNKKFLFCYDHTCAIDDCDSLKLNGRETCAFHGCKAPSCVAPAAHSSSNGIKLYYRFCGKHNCVVYDCSNTRPGDSRERCDRHTCIEDKCDGFAQDAHTKSKNQSNYCAKHQIGFCSHNDCSEKTKDNNTYCEQHICKEKDCDSFCRYQIDGKFNEKLTFCKNHQGKWCADVSCLNKHIDNSEFCNSHVCAEDNCSDYTSHGLGKKNSYCDRHKKELYCNKKYCDSVVATKGIPYCVRHNCKVKNCTEIRYYDKKCETHY